VAISLKRVKIEEKLLWKAYIELTNALSNDVPSPTASPSPRLGVRNHTQNCNRKSRENECTVRVRLSPPKHGMPYQTMSRQRQPTYASPYIVEDVP